MVTFFCMGVRILLNPRGTARLPAGCLLENPKSVRMNASSSLGATEHLSQHGS